jgi:hypothetical protein
MVKMAMTPLPIFESSIIEYRSVSGFPAEFIEISDVAQSPSYTIGIDANCRFTKFFDKNVLNRRDTVTLEITVSDKDIMIFVNGAYFSIFRHYQVLFTS